MRSQMEEWLEKIIQKYGDFSWPPYPRELVRPYFIEKFLATKRMRCGYIKILEMDARIYNIEVGDRFNAIIMPKKRRTGLKKSKSSHRVFQLIPQFKKRGYIVYRGSISGAETLKKGEIMKGRVHRLEIIAINHKHGTYDCVALAHIFNKDNLLENLTHCYYEKARTKELETNKKLFKES